MPEISRRLRRLMRQLNVPTPDEVRDQFARDSERAAEEVRLALEAVIKRVQRGSQTGALDGYLAQKRIGDEATKLVLRRSRIDLSGHYEWIIYVVPSPAHAELDLNLFDLLDQGRPELPKRLDLVYPLWGAGLANVSRSNSRIQGSEGRLQAGRNPDTTADFRQEPRQFAQRGTIPFSHGPLAAVPAKFLYEAARRLAKDRLAIAGLDRQWDVIKIGLD